MHDEGLGWFRGGGGGGGGGFGRDAADVAGFFFEFAESAFGGGFVGVDQAGGDFDGDGLEGGAELFLQQEGGAGGVVEDRDDADAVGLGGFGAGLRGRRRGGEGG